MLFRRFGAAVVVFVMANDQSLRHSFDSCRIASQWFHPVQHQRHPLQEEPDLNLVEQRNVVLLGQKRDATILQRARSNVVNSSG